MLDHFRGHYPVAAPFEDGLRDRGWVEGRNILIERRYFEGRSERYPDLAAELVRLKVDVILAACVENFGDIPPSETAAR